MSTSSLSNYLSAQKSRFLADQGQGWTIAMGNEAGDLDSLASSIAYAWLLSHTSATDGKAIALITTSRQDFVLRAENVYALQLAGIGEQFQELLCPEDLPKPNLCTNYALVDHNSLHPDYAKPDAQVIAVIDHHEDEGKYLDTASPRIIEPSGSCASLVTGLIMSNPTLQIPPELATLLLCAIQVDTQGLRKGGKALNMDHKASAWLLPRSNASSSDGASVQTIGTSMALRDHPLIKSLSSTLSAKKLAVSHLTPRDLLRRDYKEYNLNLSPSVSPGHASLIKAGLATVPLRLSSFFSPSPTSAVTAIQDWMKERGLSVLGVLTTFRSRKGKGKREQMWVVDEESSGRQLSQGLFCGLEANGVLQLKSAKFKRYGFKNHAGIEESDEEDKSDVGDLQTEEPVGRRQGPDESPFSAPFIARVYKQKDASATRKLVAPILKQILE
ncbi:DHH phosphoesterase [Paxillus ammoniavirescens]|nr:DHH phosphoesterase [Paxillus ammoniavirescens]